MGCIKRGESAPVLCSGESQMGALHPDPGPPAQNMDLLVEGIENRSCEDRLRQMGLSNLEKRRFLGDLLEAFQYKKRSESRRHIFVLRSVVTR